MKRLLLATLMAVALMAEVGDVSRNDAIGTENTKGLPNGELMDSGADRQLRDQREAMEADKGKYDKLGPNDHVQNFHRRKMEERAARRHQRRQEYEKMKRQKALEMRELRYRREAEKRGR